MPTRQEYIDIGQRYDHRGMLEQLEYALALATRDKRILASCGWIEKDTVELTLLRANIASRVTELEQLDLVRQTRLKAQEEVLSQAKRWRMQALAIGRNCLDGDNRLCLESLARPTYSQPQMLAETVQGLLETLKRYTEVCAPRGGGESCVVEGQRLYEVLLETASGRLPPTQRGEGAKVHPLVREVDELCGRAWDALKKLNRSGRAAQLLEGNRRKSAEYNLDLLRGRTHLSE